MILIHNFGTSLAFKGMQLQSDLVNAGAPPVAVDTTDVLNYIKISNSDSSNFTAGTIVVYGRN